LLYQYRPLHSCLIAESCIKHFMHFRDRGCVRTLRPLFVYATAVGLASWLAGYHCPLALHVLCLSRPVFVYPFRIVYA